MINKIEYIFRYITTLTDQKQNFYNLYFFLSKNLGHAPGSINNKHQCREGGYFDHIYNMLNMSEYLYKYFSSLGILDFTINNVTKVILLHDIEKPFKYTSEGIKYLKNNNITGSDYEIRDFFIKKYDIKLNNIEKNALKYIHGEGDDYSETERIMKPLAAFCHILDISSARIFFNQ